MTDLAAQKGELLHDLVMAITSDIARQSIGGRQWARQALVTAFDRWYQRREQQITGLQNLLGAASQLGHELISYWPGLKLEFSLEGEVLTAAIQRQYCPFHTPGLRGELCPLALALITGLARAGYPGYGEEVTPGACCCIRLVPSQPLDLISVGLRRGNPAVGAERVLLMPLQQMGTLLASLKHYSPHIVRHVLYDASYEATKQFAAHYQSQYQDNRQLLNGMLRVTGEMGFGHLEAESMDLATGRGVFTCPDSFAVSIERRYQNATPSHRAVCHTLRGLIAATMTVACGRQVSCEELECRNQGLTACKFVVQPLAGQVENSEGAVPVAGQT